jgi:hypothetical protein
MKYVFKDELPAIAQSIVREQPEFRQPIKNDVTRLNLFDG